MNKPTTLGELKQTEWGSDARVRRTVKDELRENLICLLENGAPLFPGIVGYQDTVIPQLVNGILSRHNFILLGLRGQAKSRILRALVTLLDEEIPILAGSEVNDSPFAPISKYGRELVNEHGDGAPVAWLPRDSRYVEKLATPDVTIADIIGDVDPIKAARGGHLLSDELTMHFGLLPRANRGVLQRLPISVLENVISNAERRTITTKEKTVVPRVSDVYAALPAITGKLELEYEGELQGPEAIAKDLIRRAAGKTFAAHVGGANVDDIVHWFDEGGALKISTDERAETVLKGFSVVPGLLDLVDQVGLAGKKDPGTVVAACELILEGLVAEKRISRSEELGYVRARPDPKGPPYGKSGSGGGGGPNLFS